MSKKCYNCIKFSSCPFLKEAKNHNFESIDDLPTDKYSKECLDFMEN